MATRGASSKEPGASCGCSARTRLTCCRCRTTRRLAESGSGPPPRPPRRRRSRARRSGQRLPVGAPLKSYDITALDLGTRALYRAETSTVAALKAGLRKPEPLVLHVAAGDCLQISLLNTRDVPTSFSIGKLDRSAANSGVNVGYTPEETVPRRTGSRFYSYYVDNAFLGSATIADFAGHDSKNSQKLGMYGAVIVSPAGATFGFGHSPTAVGAQVDVHLPAPSAVRGAGLPRRHPAAGRQRPARRAGHHAVSDERGRGGDEHQLPDRATGDATELPSDVGGVDPATPVIKTYAGDPLLVHEMWPLAASSHTSSASAACLPRATCSCQAANSRPTRRSAQVNRSTPGCRAAPEASRRRSATSSTATCGGRSLRLEPGVCCG